MGKHPIPSYKDSLSAHWEKNVASCQDIVFCVVALMIIIHIKSSKVEYFSSLNSTSSDYS